jgi:hypothetical protein
MPIEQIPRYIKNIYHTICKRISDRFEEELSTTTTTPIVKQFIIHQIDFTGIETSEQRETRYYHRQLIRLQEYELREANSERLNSKLVFQSL